MDKVRFLTQCPSLSSSTDSNPANGRLSDAGLGHRIDIRISTRLLKQITGGVIQKWQHFLNAPLFFDLSDFWSWQVCCRRILRTSHSVLRSDPDPMNLRINKIAAMLPFMRPRRSICQAVILLAAFVPCSLTNAQTYHQPLSQHTPPGQAAAWLNYIRQYDPSWLQPVKVQVQGGGTLEVYSGSNQ